VKPLVETGAACPAQVATYSGGKFVVTRAGEAYDVPAKGLNGAFQLNFRVFASEKRSLVHLAKHNFFARVGEELSLQ
jgi:hypothetical protein